MRSVLLLALLATPSAAQLPAAQLPAAQLPAPSGVWRAWLASPGGQLPFGLEIEDGGAALRATVRNGEERIRIPRVAWDGERLVLGFDHYGSQIAARLVGEGQRLRGIWRRQRDGQRRSEMVFGATRGASARFPPLATTNTGMAIDGRWSVQFEKDRHPAVGIFAAGGEGTATGTFLTTLGDYRFLAGRHDAGGLRLSCFDGAHAFLFHAALHGDGTLRGDFWSSDRWHETWAARRDGEAALPDAFALTRYVPDQLGAVAFPDLDGKLRKLDDPAFAGRARLLVVFGSWCPNCHDEAATLNDLQRKYGDRGLSILGLAFERTGDFDQDRAQVRRYVAHRGIEYPILIAGVADKQKASAALPLLDAVRAYPTTIFLHGDGRVRAVHTGFQGPATGTAHRALRARFEALIEELLGVERG